MQADLIQSSAARGSDCRKESSLNNEKMTILYSRLSRDDLQQGESLSIEHQKQFLEEYAERNGFTNLVRKIDDGISGTHINRPAFQEMIAAVEAGKVAAVLTKDLSRFMRDHIRAGLYLEMFQEKNVRFVAIGDNVDTAAGTDDFITLRNLFNEWFARDTSKKIRAINDSRTKNGKHVTGAVPYGYLRDPNVKSRWILDEAVAPIVRRIYQGVIDGKGVTQIADELTAEGILIPTAHWSQIGAGMRSYPNANPTKWQAATVIQILKKEEYMGWCVLNKTVKETYKSKRKPNDPANWLIFKDAHPAIVSEEVWNVVQRLRETKRVPRENCVDSNPLTGILYCADCGHKMYHKMGKADGRHKPHDEYCCSSYRHYSRSCTYHYIRVVVLEKLILQTIRAIAEYVRTNEAEFIERVRERSALQSESAAKESRKALAKSKHRRDELAVLVKKLYEGYALDKIPETTFAALLSDYTAEQKSLDAEIAKMQSEVDNYAADSMRADKFIDLVHRFTEFDEFTPTLLNEFVERVIVHEADKSTGQRTQEIAIIFNFIGRFDPPQRYIELPAEEKKSKKPRTEKERQRDRERYAKIRDARIAKQKAERAAILEGTSFVV